MTENILHAREQDKGALLKNAYSKYQESFQPVNQELIYLTHILQHISEALLFITLDGSIRLFNKQAEQMFKMKAPEKYGDVFPDDFFGFSMKEALKFGICHKLLYKMDWEISSHFIYEGTKNSHGILLIIKDLSEKQKLQQSLTRGAKLQEMGKWAATIAHEIRNPLGGLRGYASLLVRDLQDTPYLQEMASMMVEGVKRLETLVGSLLHYSKPLEIEIQTADLGAFLKQLGRFIKVDPAFPSHIRLSLHVPDAPVLVPFDKGTLKSALLNLIFNAIQAMGGGGELTISLMLLPSSCQIAVSDTGVGIEEEVQPLLFSPFFTTKKGGNGLGLVEVKKIVEAHLGHLDLRSKVGVGSTFTITLPLKR